MSPHVTALVVRPDGRTGTVVVPVEVPLPPSTLVARLAAAIDRRRRPRTGAAS